MSLAEVLTYDSFVVHGRKKKEEQKMEVYTERNLCVQSFYVVRCRCINEQLYICVYAYLVIRCELTRLVF